MHHVNPQSRSNWRLSTARVRIASGEVENFVNNIFHVGCVDPVASDAWHAIANYARLRATLLANDSFSLLI